MLRNVVTPRTDVRPRHQNGISISSLLYRHKKELLDFSCFNAKCSSLRYNSLKRLIGELACDRSLEIIMLKLWDLGKYLEFNRKLMEQPKLVLHGTQSQIENKKKDFLQQHDFDKKYLPYHTMTEATCHNLMAKIALSIYCESIEMLCIDDRIFNLDELEELTSEKDEVDFM